MKATTSEPWKNSVCFGYIISALENLGYKKEQITKVVMELEELFDWMTVEEAEEIYIDSRY